MNRKILFLLLCAAIAWPALAQSHSEHMAVAVDYNYAYKHEQSGVGLKFLYAFTDNWRVEPEVMYLAKNEGVSTLNLSLNAHYVLPLASRVGVYALAGINYSHWGLTGPDEDRVGANLGAGVEMRFNPVGIFAEHRFQLVSHESQNITSVGLRFYF